MAMMDQGTAGSRRHSRSCSCFCSGRGARTYCSRTSRSARCTQAGTSSESDPRPYFIRFAMRWMSTVVLPLPAPASSSSGPSVHSAARRCSGFRFWKSSSMAARRALQKRSSSSLVSMDTLLQAMQEPPNPWTALFVYPYFIRKRGQGQPPGRNLFRLAPKTAAPKDALPASCSGNTPFPFPHQFYDQADSKKEQHTANDIGWRHIIIYFQKHGVCDGKGQRSQQNSGR